MRPGGVFELFHILGFSTLGGTRVFLGLGVMIKRESGWTGYSLVFTRKIYVFFSKIVIENKSLDDRNRN